MAAPNWLWVGLQVYEDPRDDPGATPGLIYLIDWDGTKRHISDWHTYDTIFDDRDHLTAVSRVELDQVTEGPPIRPGTFLARPPQIDDELQTVFLIKPAASPGFPHGPVKRWVTNGDVFAQFHFNRTDFYEVRKVFLDRMPDGMTIG